MGVSYERGTPVHVAQRARGAPQELLNNPNAPSAAERQGLQTQRLRRTRHEQQREFFIDNLLVRVHHIYQRSWLTGLAPWEF
jgi:hypothetical protein